MYWAADALSTLVLYGGLTEEQIAGVDAELAELQQQCYDAYEQLKTAVAAAEDEEAAAQAATEISASTAEAVHTAIVEMVNSLQ